MKLSFVGVKPLGYELGEVKYVEHHRKLNCIFYDFCLDVACIMDWNSFTCLNCHTYFPDDAPPNDFENCKLLLIELIKQEKKPIRKYQLQRRLNEFSQVSN